MPEQEEFHDLGAGLAHLIASLPPEERNRFQHGIALLVHDLRQAIGIIYTAGSLLERKVDFSPEDTELLQAMERASKHAVGILTDFAKPFDSGITLPVGKNAPKLK